MSDCGTGMVGKRHLKVGVQPKHYFGLGRQQSDKAMLVTRPMLILLYPDCGDILASTIRIYDVYYPAHACAKGLRNWICPSVSLSVSLSVCPVKNFEIRLKDCCMRQ